jgi:hypothetical protein
MKTPEPLDVDGHTIATEDLGRARLATAMIYCADDHEPAPAYLSASECREIAAKLTEIAAWIEAGR